MEVLKGDPCTASRLIGGQDTRREVARSYSKDARDRDTSSWETSFEKVVHVRVLLLIDGGEAMDSLLQLWGLLNLFGLHRHYDVNTLLLERTVCATLPQSDTVRMRPTTSLPELGEEALKTNPVGRLPRHQLQDHLQSLWRGTPEGPDEGSTLEDFTHKHLVGKLLGSRG